MRKETASRQVCTGAWYKEKKQRKDDLQSASCFLDLAHHDSGLGTRGQREGFLAK